MKRLRAPWTPAQVDALQKRQERLDLHPYTCECGESYTPYPSGWQCDYCYKTQDWCFEMDVEEE